MTEELRKSIDDIRKLTPQLNKATDDANEVVARVGAFLSECDVGIPVSVQFDCEDLTDDEHGNTRERVSYLSYARVQGVFQIAVETVINCNTNDPSCARCPREDIQPWSCCTRSLKLSSFAVLPRLLVAIANRVRVMAAETAKTVEAVEKIIKAMHGK